MKYLPMKKIEVDFRLDEPPIVWDPQDAFIENLSTKIYYAVPAFIGGVIVGTILWVRNFVIEGVACQPPSS